MEWTPSHFAPIGHENVVEKRFSKSGSLAYRSQDFGFFKPFVFNDLGRETSDSLSRGW